MMMMMNTDQVNWKMRVTFQHGPTLERRILQALLA